MDLFVNVSVVARPTKVSVDVGNVKVPVLLIVLIIGLVSVLFVKVCVPVNVTTVESIAIVTGAEPLKLVPDNPVPIVNALGVFAVMVALPPSDMLVLLIVIELFCNCELVTLDNAPPNTMFPLVVTVPVSVIPFTEPVPDTEVTVPEPLLLKVFQSDDVK